MITFYLLELFTTWQHRFFSVLFVPSLPDWVYSSLPSIFQTVASFNHYLPISETVTVIVSILGFTLAFKLIKVILSVFIDLNA